jgi:4-amino-4-deoxy-L-arabinose transferase-like glycosyltransferase
MHAEIAREMAGSGDWITPHFNAVRYFDKPPLLYWLSTVPFAVLGYTPAAARFWPAVGAVAIAVLTTALGVRLDGPRTGMIAGLVVAANLEVFVLGRLTKPDTVFVALITLAFLAFAMAALDGHRRRWMAVCGGALGLAVLTKDILGAIGPAAAMGVAVLASSHARSRRTAPAILALGVLAAVALPWHVAMEARNPGFLWYTFVDNHLLNVARQRIFPDEDVPLTALEFLGITAVGFFPWILALPQALVRAWRERARAVDATPWLLLALWALGVLVLFTISPFKLSHYALPAASAIALLVAREWARAISGDAGSACPRSLLVPAAIGMAALALGFCALAAGVVPFAEGFTVADVASRNAGARGSGLPDVGTAEVLPLLRALAIVFALATVAVSVAAWRRAAAFGLGALLAAMVAALPLAGRGMAEFSRSRSAEPIADALAQRASRDTVVAVEGPLENAASLLLRVAPPVRIVNGRRSTLAFGATFADADGVFWAFDDLGAAWTGSQRCFLVTSAPSGSGALARLPAERVHLLVAAGGRALYSNRGD